jgi:hypothetical protein
MKAMLRINRIASWVLLLSIIIYIISGIDMQRRILFPQISSLIHLKYSFLVMGPAFVFHASYSMNAAFKRWKLGKLLSVILLALFIALNIALFVYFVSYQKF